MFCIVQSTERAVHKNTADCCIFELAHAAFKSHKQIWDCLHITTNTLLFSTIYTKYYQETLLLLASTAAKMAVSWLKGSCSLKGPCHVPNFIWCCQQHSVRHCKLDDGNGELGYHRHLWIWFTEQQPAEGPVAQGPLKIWT